MGFGALPGRSSDTPVAFFNGRGASVQLYNRALSAEEILQNYNALLPRFYSIVTSGLVLNLDAGNPNSYSPPRSDQYASSLVLAVPMNGANNGTTFTDESATIRGSGTAKTITRVGDTKTLTAQSKFYGSSGFFDGNGDYLTSGTSNDYIFGTGDFTLECLAYFNVLNTENALITNHNADSNWVFKIVSGKLLVYTGSSDVIGTSTIVTGSWYHFSATRLAGTLRLFVNGVLETTTILSNNYTINRMSFSHALIFLTVNVQRY